MQMKPLSDTYAVSPQIAATDIAAIKEAGYTTVVCNRPDGEVPDAYQAAAIRKAAEAEGLTFVENPVQPGMLTEEILSRQQAAIEGDGQVLAYCASGNRSAIVWGLVKAPELGADGVLSATSNAGYDHSALRPQFEAASER